MYVSMIMLWKEKEKSRIRTVQMDSFRGFRGMDKAPNARTRELFGVKKGLGERIDESILRWYSLF